MRSRQHVQQCTKAGGGGGGGGAVGRARPGQDRGAGLGEVVCVCALVWTDIWGQFCDFNRIYKCGHTRSGDVRSRKTHANLRFIYF